MSEAAPSSPRAARSCALIVILLAAPLLLSGLERGIFRHGDEGRFVIAAREAARTGQWLVPPVLGKPEVAKPPLYVWLVASAGAVWGRLDEQSARLPGALAALIACGALALLAARLAGGAAGLVAGLMFATAVGPFATSRETLPDMPMTAATIVAVLAAVIAYQERTTGAALVFGAAVALAVHFKLSAGLVPPLAAVALIAAARQSLEPIRALRPGLAAAVFLLVLSPWLVRFVVIQDFWSVLNAEAGSARFWRNWQGALRAIWRAPAILGEQTLPWSVFVPAALVHLWSERSRLRDDHLLVPIAWLVATLGMVIPVHSQRWRYLLPAVAPLVLLVAVVWEAELQGAAKTAVGWLLRAPLVGVLALAAVAGALTLGGVDPGQFVGAGSLPALRGMPWLVVPVVWLAGGSAGLALLRRRARIALVVTIGVAGVTLGSLNVLTADQRDRPVDPRPFAEEVRRITRGEPIYFCCVGSLASHFHFYLDAPTSLVDDAQATRLLENGEWTYLLIPADVLPILARQGLPRGGARVLAEGKFRPYHFVLLGRDAR